jgi:hypothetical protein
MKVKLNALHGAVSQSSAEPIHLAKAGLPAYFDEQLPSIYLVSLGEQK